MPSWWSGSGPAPAQEEGVEWLELRAEPPGLRGSTAGSACVGRKASSPGPQPGAIPWLLCSDEGLLTQPERPPASWPRAEWEAGASSRPGCGTATRLVSPSMRQLRTSSRRRSHLYSTCCTRRVPSKLSKHRQSPAARGATENTGGGQKAPARTRALGCTTDPISFLFGPLHVAARVCLATPFTSPSQPGPPCACSPPRPASSTKRIL